MGSDQQSVVFVQPLSSSANNMKLAKELLPIGCLLAIVFLVAGVVLAWMGKPIYLIGAVLFFGVVWWLASIRQKKEKREVESEFRTVFESFEGSPPVLEQSSSYGFPSFMITFASEEEQTQAEESGLLAEFQELIQERYNDAGSEDKPFDADLAVSAMYEGQFDHLLANADEE